MADKYRLLKDLPGMSAGLVFNVSERDAPCIYPQLNLKNAEWFEPIEDRWKPKVGEVYWRLDDCGGFNYVIWRNDYMDCLRYNSGNCFRTRVDVELAEDQLHKCRMQFHKENK